LAIRLSQQGAITAVSQNANHPTSNEAANCFLFRAVWPAANGEFIVEESTFMHFTMINRAPQCSAGGAGNRDSSKQS
jgi:hypothetical protein